MGGVPSGFLPSSASKKVTFDGEGKLVEFHQDSREDAAGIGQSNSLYASDAELFGTMAPFLKRNRDKDIKRRNYIIQPGGAQIIWDDGPSPLAVLPTRRAFVPSTQDMRGHVPSTQEGTKLAGPAGRTIKARG